MTLLQEAFPHGLSPEEFDRGIEWTAAIYRERLVPGGLTRLHKLNVQIQALIAERDALVATLYPEGTRIAGQPYVIFRALWEGTSEQEAAEKINKQFSER